MPAIPGSQRFFESTRGRVVVRLRSGPATVEELAHQLGLTDNAVRGHLASLQHEGLIRDAGVRRDGSVGKPASLYELTADGQSALSRAYVPLVRALLDTLSRRVPARRRQAMFRDAGRALAGQRLAATGALRRRADAGVAALAELGGAATVEPLDGGYLIRGCGCPLADAVRDQPSVCTVVETFLSTITGASVRQHCEHGVHPQCRFALLNDRS